MRENGRSSTGVEFTKEFGSLEAIPTTNDARATLPQDQQDQKSSSQVDHKVYKATQANLMCTAVAELLIFFEGGAFSGDDVLSVPHLTLSLKGAHVAWHILANSPLDCLDGNEALGHNTDRIMEKRLLRVFGSDLHTPRTLKHLKIPALDHSKVDGAPRLANGLNLHHVHGYAGAELEAEYPLDAALLEADALCAGVWDALGHGEVWDVVGETRVVGEDAPDNVERGGDDDARADDAAVREGALDADAAHVG